MPQSEAQHGPMDHRMVRRNYAMLGVSSIAMLIIMYVVMFAMISSAGEFVQNLNFLYMGVMMATPMTAMMPLIMPSMYSDRTLNLIIYAGSALLFLVAFAGIRTQALVGDSQFLRSMIPHHSGAVLMCERANLRDPEIRTLCVNIIHSQTREIEQMKAIRKRLRP